MHDRPRYQPPRSHNAARPGIQVSRDTEIQVWPIKRSTDGPATVHKTLDNTGRDKVTAILIDARILTVKNRD